MDLPSVRIVGITLAGVLLIPCSAVAELITPVTVDCDRGEYVVGLIGRTGAWIDAIGPVCAGWDKRTYQPVPGGPRRLLGGSGGMANEQLCPAGSAIGAWHAEKVLVDNVAFVDRLSVHCQTLAPPHDRNELLVFGGQNSLPRRRSGAAGRCSNGHLATGVSVWFSDDRRSITNISMRCKPAPAMGSRMAKRSSRDGAVTYVWPELKVRSGDYIQLDWCREWGTNCGQPAADAFCGVQRKARALSFAPKHNVGLTVVVSDRRICNLPTCTGFTQIVCGP